MWPLQNEVTTLSEQAVAETKTQAEGKAVTWRGAQEGRLPHSHLAATSVDPGI